MRQVYIEEVVHTAVSNSDDYIYSEKVKSGKILVVNRVALWWDDMGTTEFTVFFVEDMGRKIYFKDCKPPVANAITHAEGALVIGEGDRVGGYNPAIAEDDVVHLGVFGEIWDAKDWQKYGEVPK